MALVRKAVDELPRVEALLQLECDGEVGSDLTKEVTQEYVGAFGGGDREEGDVEEKYVSD